MQTASTSSSDLQAQHLRGMFYGFIAVACFSLTLPFTKLALVSFSPYLMTALRVGLAGIAAALLVKFRKIPFPKGKTLHQVILVGFCVAFGFPLCTSLGLQYTDVSHAGVVLAILPLMTSVMGAWLHGERHSWVFWLLALTGCLTVLGFIVYKQHINSVSLGDLWLLAACLCAATGYTLGTKLSRTLGGLNTICCAVACMLPISLPLMLGLLYYTPPANITPIALTGVLYMAFCSQLFGFVPWYAGLRLGGVARVSQVQLLQTFMTLIAAATFVGEIVTWDNWAVAAIVVLQVLLAKKIG